LNRLDIKIDYSDVFHLIPLLPQSKLPECQEIFDSGLGSEDNSQDLGVVDRPDWVATEDEWQKICALEEVPALQGLSQMIDVSWNEWLEDWKCQPSPGIWHATRPQGYFFT